MKKNKAAMALADLSRRKRFATMTKEQRSEQARSAVNSRRDRQKKTEPVRWWGFFAITEAEPPKPLFWSQDQQEVIIDSRII